MPPSLQIPPHTHILLARSPAPYSPFRRRTHSPTAFSGPMARPPPSPPRPPPSHINAGRMVSATRTPTSLAPRRTIFSHCVCRCNLVECASASPYTYSSSTHRFPDECTPIEATPLLATSAELGLGLGLGLDWVHTPPHTILSFLPPCLLSHNIPLLRGH